MASYPLIALNLRTSDADGRVGNLTHHLRVDTRLQSPDVREAGV